MEWGEKENQQAKRDLVEKKGRGACRLCFNAHPSMVPDLMVRTLTVDK